VEARDEPVIAEVPELGETTVAQSRRRWLTGAGMLAGGQVVALVVGGVASIVLARTLEPAGFGTYSVLSVVVSLATILASFGLETHLITELHARASDRRTYGTAFRFSLEITAGLCIAGTAVVLARAHGVTRTASLLAVAELALTPFLLARAALIYRMQQGRVAAVGIANRLVLLGGVVLIATLHTSAALAWMMAVSALAVATEALLLGVLVGPPVGALHRLGSQRRALFIACWPLMASGFAGVAYGRIDQLLLAGFRSRSEVGTYAVAVSLTTLLSFISSVVSTTTLPGLVEISRVRQQAGDAVHRLVEDMGLLMFLPGALGVAVIAGAGGPIIQFVFGGAYGHDQMVVAVLAFSEIWVFVGTAVAAILVAINQRRALLWATVSGLIVDIVVCLLFVPRYGAIAAAWASFVSYATAALVAALIVSEVRDIARPLVGVTVKASLAAVLGAAAGAAMPTLVSAVAASALVCAAASALLFRGEVIRVWRHVAHGRLRLRT
jgi:O-antigen/teichoic acid export membrane protein